MKSFFDGVANANEAAGKKIFCEGVGMAAQLPYGAPVRGEKLCEVCGARMNHKNESARCYRCQTAVGIYRSCRYCSATVLDREICPACTAALRPCAECGHLFVPYGCNACGTQEITDACPNCHIGPCVAAHDRGEPCA